MKTLLLISLFLLMSCGDDKFNRVEELQGFRILGVVATAPEVSTFPGLSTLQLVISDPNGGGRQISGTTKSCIDPGISLGASVSCDHDPSTVPGTYDIDTINDADLGVANLYTGIAADTVNVSVPATVFAGRSAREQFNGVGYITIFEFNVDGKTVTAFKRVTATNRGVTNTNPSITDLLLNGVTIGATKPNKNDKLKVTTAAPETYNFINVDGSQEVKTEELQVAWYVSYGELNKPKTEAQEDVKYLSNPPGSTMIILSLLRDDRGGFSIRRSVLP
jgi:archaellum component FlaF (FlaF/FlaG flagellin family)